LRVADGQPTAQDPEKTQADLKRYTPHRMMWPSYWGTLKDGQVTVLNPEAAYELVRRPLKTREFTADLADVERDMNLTRRKELLGEERARVKPEEWTAEEKAKIDAAKAELAEAQIDQRMSEALAAIEEAYPDTQAVYISGGAGFVRAGDNKISAADPQLLGDAAEPYAWPLAHNVRPAQQSLGSTGCLECHSDQSLVFQAEVKPVGLLPNQQTVASKAYELQGADMLRLSTWNQLFAGRSLFKVAGLIALAVTCLIAVSAVAVNVATFWRRSG
jgi:hypothetical protein